MVAQCGTCLGYKLLGAREDTRLVQMVKSCKLWVCCRGVHLKFCGGLNLKFHRLVPTFSLISNIVENG